MLFLFIQLIGDHVLQSREKPERYQQRKREETDLLNIQCRHGDDVNDVRASANLLHVGQVPFRNIQSYTHKKPTEQVDH